MTNRFVLTSSARLFSLAFWTVAEAEVFLASRELSQETVCLSDMITDKIIFVRSFN